MFVQMTFQFRLYPTPEQEQHLNLNLFQKT
ncbi:helix-turn-helix domain-containing protein [Paenibacillus sp. MY03]